MSTKLKYGSLSKNIGRLTKLSSPRKAESPGLKAKKKSDECPSGLKKLSGNKNVTPELVEWINSLEPFQKQQVIKHPNLCDLEKSGFFSPPNEKSKGKEKEKEKEEKEVEDKENSPTTPTNKILFSPQRKFDSPEVRTQKGGKLYVRIADLKNVPLIGKSEKKVLYGLVTVLSCTLPTSVLDYSQNIQFEEGFLFDVNGDFDIKLELFIQTKNKDEHDKYQIPESLGVLVFKGLSVVSIEMLTGTYYLTKDEKDTDVSVTLQIAMKIEENLKDVHRESLPEPDFSGYLSRQIPIGDIYKWNWEECELRGRKLRFYDRNKELHSLEIDMRTTCKKPKGEEIYPYNCFYILVNSTRVYLLARSKEEMTKWMEKLDKASSSLF